MKFWAPQHTNATHKTHTATPLSAIYHTPDSREHESRTPSTDTLAYHTPNTHRDSHTPSQTRDSSDIFHTPTSIKRNTDSTAHPIHDQPNFESTPTPTPRRRHKTTDSKQRNCPDDDNIVSAFVDDWSTSIKSLADLRVVREIIRTFEKASGQKINSEKSALVHLGG